MFSQVLKEISKDCSHTPRWLTKEAARTTSEREFFLKKEIGQIPDTADHNTLQLFVPRNNWLDQSNFSACQSSSQPLSLPFALTRSFPFSLLLRYLPELLHSFTSSLLPSLPPLNYTFLTQQYLSLRSPWLRWPTPPTPCFPTGAILTPLGEAISLQPQTMANSTSSPVPLLPETAHLSSHAMPATNEQRMHCTLCCYLFQAGPKSNHAVAADLEERSQGNPHVIYTENTLTREMLLPSLETMDKKNPISKHSIFSCIFQTPTWFTAC